MNIDLVASTDLARHLELVPTWPGFATIGDKISGRIPVTRISGWADLPNVLESPLFRREAQLIYRGHRRCDWALSPSLGRLDPRRIIEREVATEQLKLFRRAVRGRISDTALVEESEEFELWSVGQHYGLHTPLLDWTYSPYVALFFAFEEEDLVDELDNPYRVIYMLNKTYVESEERCPDVYVLEPRKDSHGRLVNQAGLFTHNTYGDTLENHLIMSLHNEVLEGIDQQDEADELAKYICKIYIPNENRDDCLRHLRMMNVHHASLFPDLIGASRYCNTLVSERSRGYEEPVPEPVTPEVPRATVESPERPQTESPVDADGLASILRTFATEEQLRDSQLQSLSREMNAELERSKAVDWQKRDTVKASLKNTIRVVLRRHGYPSDDREELVGDILRWLAAAEPTTSDG